MENLTNLTSKKIDSLYQTWIADTTMRAAALFKTMELPESDVSEAFGVVTKNLRSLSDESSKGAAEHLKQSKNIYRFAGVLASLALLSIVFAFAFLVIFAVDNLGSF